MAFTPKLQQIITYLNNWNNFKNGNDWLILLRTEIGWTTKCPHDEFGIWLVERIAEELQLSNGQEQKPITKQPELAKPDKVELDHPRIRELLKATYKGEITCDEAAELVLNSGWDFVDPKGLMNKTPEEARGFMDDIAIGYPNYKELPEKRRNYFNMVIESWRRWLALDV